MFLQSVSMLNHIRAIIRNQFSRVVYRTICDVAESPSPVVIAEYFKILQEYFHVSVQRRGQAPSGLFVSFLRSIEELLILPFPIVGIQSEIIVVTSRSAL